MTTTPPTALITGASQGLGLALAEALAQGGWQLLINARHAEPLRAAQRRLSQWTTVEAIAGDVRDEILILQFVERLSARGWSLSLVVNNASTLGVTPRPRLLDTPVDSLHQVLHTNVIAPLSILQRVRPFLEKTPTIINVSSDAGANAYAGWGAYGTSKAGLDHATAILAEEQPDWHVYAFDPGDMRTAMQQDAFPGEDISDRPLPEAVAVPALLHLIEQRPANGRYIAEEVASGRVASHESSTTVVS